MKPITIKEIITATNGKLLSGNPLDLITGVNIDSRKISSGDLFVPIKGEFHDGHSFINDAINAECKGVLISDLSFFQEFKIANQDIAYILVPEPVKAIQDLSAYYIKLFTLKKIAVTGSTGKTTTKDMLYSILSEEYKTVKNYGNFNNEIGLPLSIFNVEKDHQIGIFEMGMSSLGEIDLMSEILRPDIGIITNIGLSHIEHLGSKGNILKAKMEIANYFDHSSVLIVNGDDELLRGIAREENENVFKTITVGLTSGCDVKISDVDSSKEDRVGFNLTINDNTKSFEVATPGAHNAYNCALALTCSASLGMDIDKAEKALRNFSSADKRLKIIQGQGIKIIDDTYNASPDSMKAAIDVLAGFKQHNKVAVLGDMLELGDHEKDFHKEVILYANKAGIDSIIIVGNNFSSAFEDISKRAIHEKVICLENSSKLEEYLKINIKTGDAVLVKGSRGMRMESIVNYLNEISWIR
jgi:UDP-N-acetylmuramoyl-tripeptide--D-alanyl-D-alanine ligase